MAGTVVSAGHRRDGTDAQRVGAAGGVVSPAGRDSSACAPERSADLRAYYAKHTKSDRLDSTILARMPLLHPEGLRPEPGKGPGDALRRASKMHSTLVQRRSTSLARLDALLELLGPAWHAALSADLSDKTPLKFLAAGYTDPYVLRRMGKARLARFFYRHSRGAWGEIHAERMLAAATETRHLFDGELDYPDLADDIALEARLALALTSEIAELDERIALLVKARDPHGIITSAPGVGPITGAVIPGRLGDPNRFTSLAGARSFTGLVPSLNASGLSGQHGGPTKRGDALLREALFTAADSARHPAECGVAINSVSESLETWTPPGQLDRRPWFSPGLM